MFTFGPSACNGSPKPTGLKDLVTKLLAHAEDCALISKLATGKADRETFAKLADQLVR